MVFVESEIFACDPDELAPEHQWAACRLLWVEALRRYLFDCKQFWNRPLANHEDGVQEAFADITGSMRLLKHICHHIPEAEPETIRRYFYQWTRENTK